MQLKNFIIFGGILPLGYKPWIDEDAIKAHYGCRDASCRSKLSGPDWFARGEEPAVFIHVSAPEEDEPASLDFSEDPCL